MSAYSDAIVSLSMAVTDLTVATNAAVQKIVNTSEPIGPDAAPIMAAVDQVKAATAALSAAVAPPAPAPAP